jgi:hypothetical protein
VTLHKDLKFRAVKIACANAHFSTHPLHRVAHFLPQMREVEAAHIAQFDAFKLRPQPPTRIQLRSIGRQALGMDPLPAPMREEPYVST